MVTTVFTVSDAVTGSDLLPLDLVCLIVSNSVMSVLNFYVLFLREIESSIEHMSNLRREKWVVEGKIRK